jgi:hypothetical protein
MTASTQNYYKPLGLVEAIVNDNGTKFFNGQERDMSEAHQKIFERIRDAMQASFEEHVER